MLIHVHSIEDLTISVEKSETNNTFKVFSETKDTLFTLFSEKQYVGGCVVSDTGELEMDEKLKKWVDNRISMNRESYAMLGVEYRHLNQICEGSGWYYSEILDLISENNNK